MCMSGCLKPGQPEEGKTIACITQEADLLCNRQLVRSQEMLV